MKKGQARRPSRLAPELPSRDITSGEATGDPWGRQAPARLISLFLLYNGPSRSQSGRVWWVEMWRIRGLTAVHKPGNVVYNRKPLHFIPWAGPPGTTPVPSIAEFTLPNRSQEQTSMQAHRTSHSHHFIRAMTLTTRRSTTGIPAGGKRRGCGSTNLTAVLRL